MATFSLTANDEMIERSLSGFAATWEYATAHATDASKKGSLILNLPVCSLRIEISFSIVP